MMLSKFSVRAAASMAVLSLALAQFGCGGGGTPGVDRAPEIDPTAEPVPVVNPNEPVEPSDSN